MKKDIVIFAGALFDSKLWTNRQNVAVRLAERGHRVIYVEPRHFWLTMLLGQFPGSGSRLAWLLRSHKPWEAQKNLWVVSQFNAVPRSREIKWISQLNHWLNAPVVRMMIKIKGFNNPAVLIYDTEAAQYLSAFPNSTIVYDCVDDHRAQVGVNRNPRRVQDEEEAIQKRANGISVTTEVLLKRFETKNTNVKLVPNVADIAKFRDFVGEEPEDIKNISHPRIGTVGALDVYKIDFALLYNVASLRPEWNFILVGPIDYAGVKGHEDKIEKIKSLKNVFLLGQKKMEEVPAYVYAFDVAIIPYIKSPYNDASFPLKFWEFVASGKPVVAANLPALESFKNICSLVYTPEDFEKGIISALQNNPGNKQERVLEAEKHDWSVRVDVIEKMLE